MEWLERIFDPATRDQENAKTRLLICNSRAVRLDEQRLAAYQSRGDVFQSDKEIKSHYYSDQVQNIIYETRIRALYELADGILHVTDHVETMLLIDISDQ